MRQELENTYESLARSAYEASLRAIPKTLNAPSPASRQDAQIQQLINILGPGVSGGRGAFIEHFTQIINADQTDYAGQQRQAAKELKNLARELAS